MIKPKDFPESNSNWHGKGDIGDLPTYMQDGIAVSCWQLGIKERLTALVTGRVWLHVWTNHHPPVAIATDSPFDYPKNKLHRFIRFPIPFTRYWAWQTLWWMDGKYVIEDDKIGRRDDDDDGKRWRQRWYDEMDYTPTSHVPKHRIAHAVANAIRKPLGKMRGTYSHRSDFTDPQEGLLHGSKGWSEQAFDDLIEEISLGETVAPPSMLNKDTSSRG